MTLATTYLNNDTREETLLVSVGGVLLEPISASWDFGFQKVPTVAIRVANPAPACAIFEASVIINAGFDGLTQRVFTGTVLNINTDETGCTIECQGKSKVLENAFHKIVLTVDGTYTAEELCEQLLDAAGITDYSVNLPHWHPGTQVLSTDPTKDEHPVLEFQTFGEAITKIAEIDGGRWYETPSGTIRVDVMDPIPSLSSWRTYFSMVLTATAESYPVGIVSGRPRLRRISSSQQARDVKNRCYVQGCTYEQTNPDGTISSIEIEGDASAPSPWVREPGGAQAYSDELFSNELIDTPAKAGEVAGRIVTLLNRMLTEVSATIDGDPQVTLGVTVRIEDPNYSQVTGRWFVESYSTSIDSGSFQTSFRLLGGEAAGSSLNISPFALFTYGVEYEVMGDRVWAVVTVDATNSIDPDGTIASYLWSDNQAPPVFTGTGMIFTGAIDPSAYVDPLEITLTVTDDDGATDDITLTVVIDPGDPTVWVPSVSVAFDTYASYSPDGGQTWADQLAAGGDSVQVTDCDGQNPGYVLYGTYLGAIYRTTDGLATAPTLVMAACGHYFTDILFSLNEPYVAWALTHNGYLYRSTDSGATWSLYESLWEKFGLVNIICRRISTPPFAGIWIYGGTGTGYPLMVADSALNHNWVGLPINGELLADLVGATSDLYVADVASHGYSHCIILNSSNMTSAVYWIPVSELNGSGTGWKRCLNLPAKTRGRWMQPDYPPDQYAFGYDDINFYTADVDPVAGTMTAALAVATMDAGDAANHGLWTGGYTGYGGGCYLVAAEGVADGTVYKTFDRFATVDKFRPATGFPAAPAGANAKQVRCGPKSAFYSAIGRVLIAGRLSPSGDKFAAWRSGAVDWTTKVFDGGELGTGDAGERVRALTANLWFIGSFEGYADADDRWVRTKDGGTTWDSVTNPKSGDDYWIDFAIDAGGRVWGITTDIVTSAYVVKVWYSDDDGDTWTLSETFTGTGLNYLSGLTISCHPSNQNIIAIRCMRGTLIFAFQCKILYTLDRGVSWATNYAAGGRGPIFPACTGLKTCDNNRLIIWHYNTSGDCYVSTSDDWGASWTARQMFTAVGPSTRVLGAADLNGQKAFAFTVEREVWWTQDYGNIWIKFDNQPGGSEESGLAYDPVDDALYAFTDDNTVSNLLLVQRMMPVAQDGTWVDFSDTLLPIGADTKYYSHWSDAIAVIPR